MTKTRLRVAKTLLIAVCLAMGGVTGASGEQTCAPDGDGPGKVVDSMTGFVPTFQNGNEVPLAGVFRLALRPGTEVRFLVGSTRAFGDDDSYGGGVTFPKLAAGRYRIRLSRPAVVELVQNYRRLPLVMLSADKPSGVVDIDGGAAVLQVRAATIDDIVISLMTTGVCRQRPAAGRSATSG